MQRKPLFTVKQVSALFALVLVPLFLHFALQGGVLVVCGGFRKRFFQCGLNGIAHGDFALQLGVRVVVNGAAHQGIAAYFTVFFNDDNGVCTVLHRRDRGRKAGAAATNDHDISALVCNRGAGRGLGFPFVRIGTRLGKAVFNCGFYSIACDGCARNPVDA
ncbi:hypothetical protein SDC9_203429 [bioreactor metagenome]|uniref:Uncharacterized protein n=1 Tax=bioreactor metagenome TaxID=1076179 RepID=A0A645IWE3_9ZZZZ